MTPEEALEVVLAGHETEECPDCKDLSPPAISGDCSTCYSVGILPDPEYLDACETLGIERPHPWGEIPFYQLE